MSQSQSNPIADFEFEKTSSIATYPNKSEWKSLSTEWMKQAFDNRYMYNFTCLGRPIIQTPIDIQATQELIWSVKPDLIIETGIAHGGSLILSASTLALIDYCEAVEKGLPLDVSSPKRRVLGIDIEDS